MGDKHTNFFHNVTKIHRSKNWISKLDLNQNQTIEDPKDIKREIIAYNYSTLINNVEGSHLIQQERFLALIPKIIIDEQKQKLNEKFSLEEVS